MAELDTLLAITVDVTTGASPVDIDLSDYTGWMTMAVRVTSGGTAGTEVLNFVGPPEAGALNNRMPGKTINVVFVAQTDPADVIHITQNSGGSFSCIDSLGNGVGSFATGIFDEVGNNITFGFNGDVIQQYSWNCLYGSWDSPTNINGKRNPLPTGGVYGQFLLASSNGESQWSNGPVVPFKALNAGSVAFLTSTYPAADNDGGTAQVFDADTPVVGSVVTGGGSSRCVVISNGTDYLVMFIFP